ncbi:hypothetical protein Lfu02_64080 [Longispora fulva]|uniref:SWIM-type domain-containing protein n=1 Tax=Longispora fulva TaxID=619741 RepID=A0A8J7GUU1_9ACTN|nr:hypothetical protein [Longispora fulva]MBG6137806.1 hypothetical protein [Longispora fulva]GIG62036.1 hypothetical protein Lfu02_64080 [Longispora fulva]
MTHPQTPTGTSPAAGTGEPGSPGAVALPAADALLVAEAVDGLPGRLRKRLDDMVTRAASWPVTADGDTVVVTVDGDTVVTLTPDRGVLREAGAARCSCLLAPNCLHRAAVLALAPPAGEADADEFEGVGDDMDAIGDADNPSVAAPAPLTARQRAAAEELWRSGAGVLGTGVVGSGVVTGVGLLRAAHEARAQGLHRCAAAARRVAAGLRAAREEQPGYRLGDLTDSLRDLLAVAHGLRGPEASPDLLGTARRAYDPRGSLRLYGLCTVPVVADSGHAGVITYLVDRDGTLWAVADIYPGGVGRVAGSAEATVAVGEAAISHRALGRAGLILSGATATDTGQLGAGRAVRAVRAAGAPWTDAPTTTLWAEPLRAQVHRAFEALAAGVQAHPVGDDLLFLRVRVRGADGEGVWADTVDGVPLCLTPAAEYPELPYRHNLRILARAADGELLVVGRPDPGRPGRVRALTVGVPVEGPAALLLPDEWAGRVDLGIDRLHPSHLPAPIATDESASAAGGTAAEGSSTGTVDGAGVVESGSGRGDDADSGRFGGVVAADPALRFLRAQVERAVSGGRAVQALARDESRILRRARLETGATLLADVGAAARHRPRDAFGRLADDDGHAYALAWLSAAVYEDASARAFAEATWLPPESTA